MSSDDAKLVSEPVTSVLYDLIREAVASQRIEASDDVQFYLTNLLGTFARIDADRFSHALGPELLNTANLDPAHRYLKLKELADTTLFLSGVFLDYVEAQMAATDYYFDIGSSAYLHLGQLGERGADVISSTYTELGRRFEEFVCVLSSIADSELFASNERALGLYERWLDAGTVRDARRLIALGIIPAAGDCSRKH